MEVKTPTVPGEAMGMWREGATATWRKGVIPTWPREATPMLPAAGTAIGLAADIIGVRPGTHRPCSANCQFAFSISDFSQDAVGAVVPVSHSRALG